MSDLAAALRVAIRVHADQRDKQDALIGVTLGQTRVERKD